MGRLGVSALLLGFEPGWMASGRGERRGALVWVGGCGGSRAVLCVCAELAMMEVHAHPARSHGGHQWLR